MKSDFLIHIYRFFLVLVVFTPLSLKSQDFPISITGQVVDSNNMKPLENVHITSPESQIGVVSSANGKFELSIMDLPVTLVFSRLAYQDKQIRIKQKQIQI